jgi:hypothetical protein
VSSLSRAPFTVRIRCYDTGYFDGLLWSDNDDYMYTIQPPPKRIKLDTDAVPGNSAGDASAGPVSSVSRMEGAGLAGAPAGSSSAGLAGLDDDTVFVKLLEQGL